MASEIRNRFTDTEMQIARETDLPELLSHLGYQVKRVGRFHTTAEMDSLRIKDRRTWFRYSQNTGGDAITFLQQFCGKSFPRSGSQEFSRQKKSRRGEKMRLATGERAGKTAGARGGSAG